MITAADLFCGAGGTSTGLIQAARAAGLDVNLTAINHWELAVETHAANHPDARHLCASLDSLNPRDLYREGELDLLLASPECTNHSRARGSRPISDQSRATAHCVTRWAEAIRPREIVVENVEEFLEWGPIGYNGRPIPSRKGELFRAWVAMLEACGYRVEWRVLVAADHGDPTTRKRLFVRATRGNRRIAWPEASHGSSDMISTLKPWKAAESIIDWSIPMKSWKRSGFLSDNTLRRIQHGIDNHPGEPFLVEYYGNGSSKSLKVPMPTITTKDRFALVTPDGGFRMIAPREYAGAMGFPPDYHFAGNKSDAVKQIGNAVPVGIARALTAAAIERITPRRAIA